jgi:hypothetical protein
MNDMENDDTAMKTRKAQQQQQQQAYTYTNGLLQQLPPPLATGSLTESTVDMWPFSDKKATRNTSDRNKNNEDSTNNNNSISDNDSNNSTTNDKVCYDATTCDKCNSYYTCHWCSHDDRCHAIGSIHGCMIGASCRTHPDKVIPNRTDPHDTATGCTTHTSCRNCTLSSSLCHWCAHDNMCHAIGSMYGCMTGVNCYDNPHCQRTSPEKVLPTDHHSKQSPHQQQPDKPDIHHSIGILPYILIVSISTVLVCCITSCCCILNCLKGAYDDLAILGNEQQQQQEMQLQHVDHTVFDTMEVLNPDEEEEQDESVGQQLQQEEQDEASPLLQNDTITDTTTSDNPSTLEPASINATKIKNSVPNEGKKTIHKSLKNKTTINTTENVYVRMMDGATTLDNNHDDNDDNNNTEDDDIPRPNVTTSTNSTLHQPTRNSHPHRRQGHGSRRQQRFRAMHRLYNTCFGCYICTVVFIMLGTYTVVQYFPQKPIYNICNDSVAWQSLMDSITSFTATAEVQILTSIYNPNLINVALDSGRGTFAHNGELVGTYEIPPTMIVGRAITDVLIVARLTPDKWQALSLSAEYYHGTLVLHVNADASIRIPALLDYTLHTSLQDIMVHVNELSDRQLCACPTWKDNNVTSYRHHNDNNDGKKPLLFIDSTSAVTTGTEAMSQQE